MFMESNEGLECRIQNASQMTDGQIPRKWQLRSVQSISVLRERLYSISLQ